MNNAVVGYDVSGCNFCFVNHDAARGGNGDSRALQGFDFACFDVCCHSFTGNHVVSQHSSQLGFVLEQSVGYEGESVLSRKQFGFKNLFL